jgi:hypothetical protein
MIHHSSKRILLKIFFNNLIFCCFRETYLLALKTCLTAVASKISEDIRKQTEQSLLNCQSNESDVVRQLASNCKEILLSSN